MAKTPPPRPHVRSVRVTDDRGNHYDIEGNDLKWTTPDEVVNVFSQGIVIASIKHPERVIALDWEVK